MPKDATRNVDRYKVRGGHLNTFDFHRNQDAISQQEQASWTGGESDKPDLSPDQARAERVRQLLAEHGQSLPESTAEAEPEQVRSAEQPDEQHAPLSAQNQTKASAHKPENADDEDNVPELQGKALKKELSPTHGRPPEVIREMMQARRATDVVPDPGDVAEGRTGRAARQEKGGLPVNTPAGPARSRPATRRDDLRYGATKASQSKGAEARNKQTDASQGASKVSAKSGKTGGKQATAPKDAEPIARSTSRKQSVSTSRTQSVSTKSTKKTATPESTKKAASTKSVKSKPASKNAKSAPTRSAASKSTTQARNTGVSNRTQTTGRTKQAKTTKAQPKTAGRKSR